MLPRIADEVLIQVAYAIGVADPVGLYVNTFGSSKIKMSDSLIAEKIKRLFDMRPYAIVKRFGLKNPIFSETAAYGHMGRPYRKDYTYVYPNANNGNPEKTYKEVEFFGWEKLDYVDRSERIQTLNQLSEFSNFYQRIYYFLNR
jgi:S-adenosylmethionine synthetase